MSTPMVEAEVIPVPGRASDAALRLQRLGFHVRHIGKTVSIAAPSSLWSEVFHITFVEDVVRRLPEVPQSDVNVLRPTGPVVQMPHDLADVIAEIVFPEPPQFFP